MLQSRSQKLLCGINIIAILYIAGIDLSLIKTCGGLLNPWLLINASCFCFFLPSLLIYSIYLLRTHWRPALSIFLLTLCLIIFHFYSQPGKLGFYLQKPWYEKTTQLIKIGKINPTYGLPFPYRLLTACNQNIHYGKQNKEYMFYFTEIDYLNFSGYLYSTDGSLPDNKFFYLQSHTTSDDFCDPINDQWFYCSYSD